MKSVEDIKNLEGATVLVRTSLNVPVVNGEVQDDFRLKKALRTILYLQEKRAKVVLISHITGNGTETLKPMYEILKKWIPRLQWCEVAVGEKARTAVRTLASNDVLLLENLRRNAGEEKNDPEFAKELAGTADYFVQDSFDVCHRTHASVVGIPKLLPSYAGYTVIDEVKALSQALKPRHPAVAIIAGAKFATKEPVIRTLLGIYDTVFVGGALANDFIKAKGFSVGKSLVAEFGQKEIVEMLKSRFLKIPSDAMVAPCGGKRIEGRVVALSGIGPEECVYDVGRETITALEALLKNAKTVIWNGPLGFYENGFTDSTKALAKIISKTSALSIVGGGDTITVINDLHLQNEFSFISTGGGAMLDFLAEGTLPGLDALR